MKKLALFLNLIICIFLCACKTEQTDYGKDYVYNMDSQDFKSERTAVYSQEGFYIINKDNKIDYVDIKESTCTVVDTEIEFNHLCNIVNHDGKLYILDERDNNIWSLYIMDYSGANIAEKLTFDSYDIIKGFMIHRDNVYLVAGKRVNNGIYQWSLEKISLKNGEASTIFVSENEKMNIGLLFAHGNKIYFEQTDGIEYCAYSYNIIDDIIEIIDIPRGNKRLNSNNNRKYKLIGEGNVTIKDHEYEVWYTYYSANKGEGIVFATYIDEEGNLITEQINGVGEGTDDDVHFYSDDMYIYTFVNPYNPKECLNGRTDVDMNSNYIVVDNYDVKCSKVKALINTEYTWELVWAGNNKILFYDSEKEVYVLADIENGNKQIVSNIQ